MKKHTLRNRKGVELSINMLVIVALAVFVIFLIMGFVMGGFDFFRKIFFGLSTQPDDVAKTKCQVDLTSYKNSFGDIKATIGSAWDEKLCKERWDVDFDGDGISGTDANGRAKDPNDRSYDCSRYVDTSEVC